MSLEKEMAPLKGEWEIARIRSNQSWLDIAKKLNVGRKTIYSMTSSNNPTLKTLLLLGDALNVNHADIVEAAMQAQKPKQKAKHAGDAHLQQDLLGK